MLCNPLSLTSSTWKLKSKSIWWPVGNLSLRPAPSIEKKNKLCSEINKFNCWDCLTSRCLDSWHRLKTLITAIFRIVLMHPGSAVNYNPVWLTEPLHSNRLIRYINICRKGGCTLTGNLVEVSCGFLSCKDAFFVEINRLTTSSPVWLAAKKYTTRNVVISIIPPHSKTAIVFWAVYHPSNAVKWIFLIHSGK